MRSAAADSATLPIMVPIDRIGTSGATLGLIAPVASIWVSAR